MAAIKSEYNASSKNLLASARHSIAESLGLLSWAADFDASFRMISIYLFLGNVRVTRRSLALEMERMTARYCHRSARMFVGFRVILRLREFVLQSNLTRKRHQIETGN